ncbi:MAG TPA: amino acid permease [Gaiellaceae bacterium]|nr:amino acid permease [Gaiellaceae bacterium]
MESHPHDKDTRMLHALGYAQELSRKMSGFSNFAISFTIISILSGTLTLYGTGLNYGGPVEEAYGWPIVSVFVIIVGLGMAEIASKYPTAGGLYYWASKMGGPAWGWFTGWFNLIGQIAITAGIDYGAAVFADALLQLLWGGSFHGTQHEIVVVYGVILILHALMNTFSVRLVALLNDVSVWWHVIGVLVVVAFLIFKPAHHQSFGTVFGHTVNNSGFSHSWLWFVLLLGLLQAQYTFTGYDASAHMSEETTNASRSAARGVIMSIVVSAVFGYILALGVTFAIQDISKTAGAGTFAVKQVFLDSLGTHTAEVMLFITVMAQLYCGMSSITSASRMLYAFSRDGATPGHQLWRRLNGQRVPVYAVWAIAVLAFLCAFPAYFGTNGVVAYVAVTSIATIGLYIAYAIPIYLRLRAGDSWEPGEWNLGRWYKPIGWIAVIWVVFISILFVMPTLPTGIPFKHGFTWLAVNYALIAVGGTMLLVGGWWMLSARKWFTGPVSQGSEDELARIEAQYEHGAHGGASPAA